MSKVIKNNDGVAIVEGTPAASLVKDVDKFFKEKPPERMAGEAYKPKSLSDFKGAIPVSRRLSPEEEAFAAKLNEDRLAGIQRTPEEETALRDQMLAERRDGKGTRSGRRVRQGFGMISCPDPNMLILMADGSQKKAGDLVVGDLLKTNHEKSFELGEYKVEYVNVVNDVQKIKLIFDKTEIICSLTHKFLVDKSWKEAKDMEINDEVSGKKLLSIEKVEDGDVVHITVEDAHTYICEGLLSHNKRMAPPKPDRGEGVNEPREPRPPRITSCPDPNMFILMSDDTQKKAGDLVVGDLVKTHHEQNLKLGEYEVEYVNIVENVEKIKLTFDESKIICSLTHKFYVNNEWKEAKDLVVGDEVSGKKLISIDSFENGDVVHITVKDAHTYICEGLLSHNKRKRPPRSKDPSPKDPLPRDTVYKDLKDSPMRPSPKDPLPRDTVYRDLEDSPMRPAPPKRRNEAKEKAEARRERFFQRRRSKKEARRSEEEREATKGRFITTLGR